MSCDAAGPAAGKSSHSARIPSLSARREATRRGHFGNVALVGARYCTPFPPAAITCAKMTSSAKPEVHRPSRRRQKSIEPPRPC